ncbi:hypothetical protein JIN84_17260 [Luteolibacter yonseiensis]|uniref:Uncharacterized protein n=1 Tax=Luteolibacter yonseiensis TaxID=1144680 RepID=A0A934V8L2_9BACT|nr:hypothetical protein [Luteolibacter yonseiensis]MBK1817372.1 hypothetical protein [Luteolibacter yonseiensis]
MIAAVGQRQRISRRLESWRTELGLRDFQIRKLREIEYGFHGSGNPFSENEPSAEEIDIHEKQIASVMGPESGKRYLDKVSRTRH